MNQPYISKLGNPFSVGAGGGQPFLMGHIQHTAGLMPMQQTLGPSSTSSGSFSQVMLNTIDQANGVMQKPDALMQEMMLGGKADVHDVMIANAKAELTVNMAANIATKVVQAYDRILQIQV